MRMKKILFLTSILFLFLSTSLVSACVNPVVKDSNGAQIYGNNFCPLSGCNELFIIDGRQYQSGPINYYTLQFENYDSIPTTFVLQQSASLVNYMSPAMVLVPPLSTQSVQLMIWTDGNDASGSFDVTSNCADGFSISTRFQTQIKGKLIADPSGPMPTVTVTTTTDRKSVV